MEHAALVHVMKCEGKLRKPLQDLLLCERPITVRRDPRREVATLAVLHDEREVLAVHKGVAVADDAGVLKPLQGLRLEQRRAPLLALNNVHALEHIRDALLEVPHRVDRALRASTDAVQLLV